MTMRFSAMAAFFLIGCSVFSPVQARDLGITQWVTPYGVKVLFLPAKEIPMVDLNIDVDAGSRWDPAQQAGLAAMTQGLLSKGTNVSVSRMGGGHSGSGEKTDHCGH